MRVSKWGNSLAVRIPNAVVSVLGLNDGDEIEVSVTDTAKPGLTISRKLTRAEIIERLKRFEGMRPKGYVFNREEANER